MKKWFSLLCVSVAFSLLLSANVIAASPDSESYGSPPQVRMTCPNCMVGPVIHICYGDRERDETGTHLYGLFQTCTFTDYISRSAEICASCGTIVERYDYHWCWRVHSNCGAEYESVCICTLKDESFWD